MAPRTSTCALLLSLWLVVLLVLVLGVVGAQPQGAFLPKYQLSNSGHLAQQRLRRCSMALGAGRQHQVRWGVSLGCVAEAAPQQGSGEWW